jgi:hypothetical protein
VRHLVLQPGVSYSCLKGMVSSHVAAATMDFTRFERHISRQDPKELLPQVRTVLLLLRLLLLLLLLLL